jgi:small subunit ribosomal protein S7
MPRKGPVAKRDVLPDPLYNSKLVTRLINKMMVDGKRGKSQEILYSAFDTIRERTGSHSPLKSGEPCNSTLMGWARG